MKQRTKATLISLFSIIVILACSINNIQISEQPKLELTITAQAQQLQQGNQPVVQQPAQPAEQQAAQVDGPPEGPDGGLLPGLNTDTPTPAANVANGSTGVTVSVSVETNCRKGPSVNFASVYSLSVSQVAEVIGKNTSTGYWIIKIPGGGGATCWLWGKYATVNGNTGGLAEVATPAPPPTSTATNTKISTPTSTVTSTFTSAPVSQAPAAPSITHSTIICADQGNGTFLYSWELQWADNSNNEQGFEIGLDPVVAGVAAIGLNSNTTYHSRQVLLPSGTAYTLSLFAYNGSLKSSTSQVTLTCP